LAAASLKAQAVRLLARREYARAELEERLVAKGAARAEVRGVIDELVAAGYLSNERYAHAVSRQMAGRYSRRSIAGQLKAKGIEGEDIAAALSASGIDDAAALEALWRRRFGALPADDREKARQVRFLQARGFAVPAILKLLRELGR
jgi:regulatory protein